VANETAKVVRFHTLGGPEVLKIQEEPIPEPGKGEVRLNVKAIGLNRAEVMDRWFGKLTDKRIRRGTFFSVQELERAIQRVSGRDQQTAEAVRLDVHS
jgi:hypothetical protein